MTKKIQLKKILNSDFGWAISNVINLPMPAKASYWLTRIFKKTQSLEKDFMAVREKTLLKFTEQEEKDGQKVFKQDPQTKEYVWKTPEARKEFITEMDILLEEEIEMPTIAFAALGEDIKIEPRMLLFLEEVIIQEGVQGTV